MLSTHSVKPALFPGSEALLSAGGVREASETAVRSYEAITTGLLG